MPESAGGRELTSQTETPTAGFCNANRVKIAFRENNASSIGEWQHSRECRGDRLQRLPPSWMSHNMNTVKIS